MTTNERYSKNRQNDGDNNSVITKTLSGDLNPSQLQASSQARNSNSVVEESKDSNGNSMRETFIGPSNPSCFGNCVRMIKYKEPSQKKMYDEIIGA